MGKKTRPPPGNRNSIVLQGFSNSESEKRYRLQWPGEPEICAAYKAGNQCGGCTFYAEFDSDFGLCCNPRSRHHTETVFEHFSCANYDYEGWGAHSFQARERRNIGMRHLPKKAKAKRKRPKRKSSAETRFALDPVADREE